MDGGSGSSNIGDSAGDNINIGENKNEYENQSNIKQSQDLENVNVNNSDYGEYDNYDDHYDDDYNENADVSSTMIQLLVAIYFANTV